MEEEEIVWEIREIDGQGGGESPPLFQLSTSHATAVVVVAVAVACLPATLRGGIFASVNGGDVVGSISNKRGRVAASSKAIQGLRVVTAPPTDGSDDRCAICLQDLDYSDKVRLRAMPCSHSFHQHCIFKWLRRNAVCPLCRRQLSTEDDDEQEQDQGRRTRLIMTRHVYNIADGQHYTIAFLSDDNDDGDDEEEEAVLVVDPEQDTAAAAALREHLAILQAAERSDAAAAENYLPRGLEYYDILFGMP